MRRKLILFMMIGVFVSLPMLGNTPAAQAGTKSLRNLVGAHGKWIQRMKSDKNFAKKRILLVVGDKKKASTVAGLLEAVEIALSEPQHSVFVIPLIVAENQNVSYVSANVSGAFVREIKLSEYPPADQRGLASLVIHFDGDSTLPLQVIANLKPE